MIKSTNYDREHKCSVVEVHGAGSDIINEYSCIGLSLFHTIMDNDNLDNKTKIKALLMLGDSAQSLLKDVTLKLEDLKE